MYLNVLRVYLLCLHKLNRLASQNNKTMAKGVDLIWDNKPLSDSSWREGGREGGASKKKDYKIILQMHNSTRHVLDVLQ